MCQSPGWAALCDKYMMKSHTSGRRNFCCFHHPPKRLAVRGKGTSPCSLPGDQCLPATLGWCPSQCLASGVFSRAVHGSFMSSFFSPSLLEVITQPCPHAVGCEMWFSCVLRVEGSNAQIQHHLPIIRKAVSGTGGQIWQRLRGMAEPGGRSQCLDQCL